MATSVTLDSNNGSWIFTNLSAGVLYTAVVTTVSGPFSASSGIIANATCKYNRVI